jgi:3-mercaptopyruvate sulfurtransferase SseA
MKPSDNPFALIHPQTLIKRLAQEEFPKTPIILEAHFSSVDHPLDPEMPVFQHLPGAIQIHPSYLESGINRSNYYPFYDHPNEANVMPAAELQQALESLGITPASEVVVYGSDPDGVMAAARLCWGLIYAGVRQVRLLDGGIDTWLAHGGQTCLTIKSVWNVHRPGQQNYKWSLQPEYLTTMDEVKKFVTGDPFHQVGKLIDVRTAAEWHGTSAKKYTFFSKTGHIPRAIHQGDWDNLLDGSSKSLAPHLEIVAARWRTQGIIDDEVEAGITPLTFYCGTGWRSSIAFLVAHLLGLSARNFESGFYGWSHHPENPIGRSLKAGVEQADLLAKQP